MNLIDDDIKINRIVEEDVPDHAKNIFGFFKSHIGVQLVGSILVVFFACFISVSMHISTHYNRLGAPEERAQYYQILLYFFITFFVAFVAWYLVIRFLIRPVFRIKKEMDSIKTGNLYKQIAINGNNELWQLAYNYNLMATELGNQKLECSYEHEERLKAVEARHAAERRSIENIINTNFSYEIINYLVQTKEKLSEDKAKEILSILSDVLHYINNNYSGEINVGTEIEWISKYLYLQKILKGNLFEYEIDFSDNFANWPCVKLFILPYVENCIIHGFNNIEEGGMIKIFASEFQNKLILNIWDNGKGYDEDSLSEINYFIKNLKNVNLYETKTAVMNNIANLYDYYGERLDIKINSMQDDGTCITMSLPLPNKFSWQGLE